MVPMPQKNGDILPWAEQASREINRFSASGVPGMLVRDGVGGVGFEQTPQNLRDRVPSADVLPWSFSCTETDDPENPGEKKRTGGWDNCRLQVGLDCNFYSSWKFNESENRIKGTHLTDDGDYYLRVNLSDGANPVAEIVLQGGGGQAAVEDGEEEKPLFDYERGIVSIFIGSVTDGKLDERTAMHMNPTVWKYL